MSIIKVDALPEITRQSAASGLILEIREALEESLDNGQAFKIDDLFEDKDFHNMQQRVRTQARKLGMNASVRRAKDENALYFIAIDEQSSAVNTQQGEPLFDAKGNPSLYLSAQQKLGRKFRNFLRCKFRERQSKVRERASQKLGSKLREQSWGADLGSNSQDQQTFPTHLR